MKKTVFAVLLLGFLSTVSSAQARQIIAESRVSDVTVYGDRAMVKRTASVKLEKGENVVVFEGIPLQVSEDTLRAEGRGAANARIEGLAIKTVYLENNSEKWIRDLEIEIQTLERSVKKIDARSSAFVAQKEFVHSIKLGWGERISKELTLGKPGVAELGEANRFVGESVQKLEEGLFDAEAEKKPLLDKIAALKKQLADLGRNSRKEVRTAEVTIDAAAAMKLDLELSYLVSQARWEPTYDIRLSPDGKSAELLYRAVVAQSSGEDWSGVNLSLSTAAPSVGSAPPELQPWNINFPEPVRPAQGRSYKMAMKAVAPAPMALEADSMQAEYGAADSGMLLASHQSSRIIEGQSSVQFTIPKSVDVPADGSRQTSLIAAEKITVKAEFVTVPKLSQAVFLKSEVTNETTYPLLAGVVNVFNDTAYVGKSYLKPVAPGEKFDLFFGNDNNVKVKRSVVKVRKEAGLLAGNSVSWKCTVELENFRKEEIVLSLIDQLPLAGNEEIKVVLRNSDPTATESRNDGRQLWKLNLKPGEKRTVSYQIDVDYPKGKDIVGAE
ncbi:MAG: mucoidy inhibitor MuiA family protein [Geobacteraceae bacterium]|nr:mucoidy inhibitor MuiA family protein [Geobacteraceae bacterium]